ncbi:MAG: hypothetical protein KDA41_06775 [Planctomycetales bacterium]|nr:hypothetical protein [Planctomycetales bacterium]
MTHHRALSALLLLGTIAASAAQGQVPVNPYVAAPATGGLGAPDFYGSGFSTVPQAGVAYTPSVGIPYAATGVPQMPPPPGLAPPSVTANGPVIVNQPISPAPVPQGFGANVAPALPPAPVIVQPAPGAVGAPMLAPAFVPTEYVKFVQNVRLRHTWLMGNSDPNEFGINDTEAAATFAYPDFLWSQQPLLITPGFILSFWDPPAPAGAALPSRVYGGYLDFYWTPKLTERLTAELDFRIGVYSDFEKVSSDAIRPQGYGAGILQLSPTLAFKGGVAYINRVDIEMLPVIGLVWTPNPYTYFDATFPNPKLSHYGWTWGQTDVWWYIAGEYGGGTWEVGSGVRQRVDVNDLRAILGLEWTGGWWGTKGFVEVGYVFNRDIVFDKTPAANFSPDDTFMLRGGLAF